MLKKYTFLLWGVFSLVMVSCSQDETYEPIDEPDMVSPVVFDINSVPYPNLSDYNFYEGQMSDLEPVYGVLPYTLINTLFTDYAKKKRFIWMPSDAIATYENDNAVLNLGVGTVLIKNFYYDNVLPNLETKILETRLMIHKETGWTFANYVWNEAQTEAVLDLGGSFSAFDWIQDGETKSVNYRIPAGPECQTCHKSGDVSIPIGPKPRNLNLNYPYADGTKNQLDKLVAFGYLENSVPNSIETMVAWNDTSQPLNDRVRSYVDINCAHCHSEDAHCAYRPMRFNFDLSDDPVNMGVCVEPDTDLDQGQTHIVSPSNQVRSMMYYRISSTDEAVRMPLLGRTIVHEEGIQLVYDWIGSLTTECE
ncbi:MAG: hypothetical protein KJP20_04075 [Bacteroidia bacterium]|nr:hypothetical protein [Bacteroidia bacterium]